MLKRAKQQPLKNLLSLRYLSPAEQSRGLALVGCDHGVHWSGHMTTDCFDNSVEPTWETTGGRIAIVIGKYGIAMDQIATADRYCCFQRVPLCTHFESCNIPLVDQWWMTHSHYQALHGWRIVHPYSGRHDIRRGCEGSSHSIPNIDLFERSGKPGNTNGIRRSADDLAEVNTYHICMCHYTRQPEQEHELQGWQAAIDHAAWENSDS